MLIDRLREMQSRGETIHPLDAGEAYVLAKQLHKDQVRWYTNEPYFNHVDRVTASVQRSPEWAAADEPTKRVMLVAAVLHDAVEDTELTLDDVIEFCGPEVAEVVELLTHDEGMSYERYMVRLMQNPIARIIKRADTCDNLATLPFNDDHSARLWKKYYSNMLMFALEGGAQL